MRDDPRERWNESDKVELRGCRITCSGTALPRFGLGGFAGSGLLLAEFVHDSGTATDGGPVDLVRRAVAQRLVASLRVVEPEVIRQPDQQLRQAPIAPEIHVLVLDAPP